MKRFSSSVQILVIVFTLSFIGACDDRSLIRSSEGLRTMSANDTSPGLKVKVLEVHDGDSLNGQIVSEQYEGDVVEVRIRTLECPETSINSNCREDARHGKLTCREQIPLGRKAKKFAQKKLQNRVVTLKPGRSRTEFEWDDYDRLLATVTLPGGRSYAGLMTEQDMCRRWENFRGARY